MLTISEVSNNHKGALEGYFDQFTSDNAHRVAMAALPLFFYFSATVYPAFLITAALSVKDDTYKLIEVLGKKEVGEKESLSQMAKTAASVGILAIAVFSFSIARTASLVMSTMGDVASIYYYLVEEYNSEKAALSLVKLVGHTAALSAIILGGIEFSVFSSVIGLGVTAYYLAGECWKESPQVIEGTGLALLVVLKVDSLNSKISRLAA